ncbi:MAG: hypothetical protein ACLP01_32220 [Solirubrobacteraceae bacterium]
MRTSSAWIVDGWTQRPANGLIDNEQRLVAATIYLQMATTELLIQSWDEAAEDLDLVVEQLHDATLVRNFGRPRGMLCAL